MDSNNEFLIAQVLEEADEHLSEAFKVGDHYVNDMPYYNNPDNLNFEMEISQIKYNIKWAWLCVLSILEKYRHPTLLSEAKNEYVQYSKTPLRQEMGLEDPYLYWPNYVKAYVNALRSFYVKKDLKGISSKQKHVVDIIKRSDRFVTSRDIFGFAPCNEADVHDRLDELLKCSFQDHKRKPSISKTIKNFIPDASIPSLNLIIEYKYVSSIAECGPIVDQIIGDIGGYQTPKKELMLFVIYETGRFFHSDDWKRAIRESQPPSPVEHVLIRGIEPTQDDIDLKTEFESRIQKLNKKPRKQPRGKPKTSIKKKNTTRSK